MRINNKITSSQVMVIDEDGKGQLGVMNTAAAVALAMERGTDLVEVAPEARPPVCRLMDYGKFKYKQKKKTQHGHKKAHVTHVKELRIRPKIGAHDMDVKLRKAREIILEGDRLVVNLLFRGRELAHRELGEAVLKEVVEKLSDVAKAEGSANFMGKKMSIVLIPKQTT